MPFPTKMWRSTDWTQPRRTRAHIESGAGSGNAPTMDIAMDATTSILTPTPTSWGPSRFYFDQQSVLLLSCYVPSIHAVPLQSERPTHDLLRKNNVLACFLGLAGPIKVIQSLIQQVGLFVFLVVFLRAHHLTIPRVVGQLIQCAGPFRRRSRRRRIRCHCHSC